MNFVEELRWRGMVQDIMPGTEEQLLKEPTTAYIGFDPTADSLHVGSLVPIMILLHFQRCGHHPIALVGGATGLIGDPSGKKAERKLLQESDVEYNLDCIRKQLSKFLDFDHPKNAAKMVNNMDWFRDMNVINFYRDIGKHLNMAYLLGKAFIKDRLSQEAEFSFTEFNYIMLQSYDFYWLYENMNCKLQLGGSDQWGNITAGAELIRKKIRGEAFALTTPLMTKADGSKFGKSESGNIWLDAKKTSPYAFYQFWLNAADEDAKKFIRIFTLMDQPTILALEAEHDKAPHLRLLQKAIAQEVTIRVHSKEDYETALEASEILFGKGTTESLKRLNEETFLSVFEGVPQVKISKSLLDANHNVVEFLSDHTGIFPSRGEARKMLQAGGVSMNKEKLIDLELAVNASQLINTRYLLVQKGKKNYYLVIAE